MKNCRIIPMTAGHLPQVEDIEKACFSDPWPRRLLEEMLELPQAVNLAAVDGENQVLGYIGLQSVLDEGSVNNLAVRPDCRRQGIGSALLEAARQAGEARELAYLILEVRVSNKNAQQLYIRHGYRVVGRRKNYYSHPKEDAIYMKLELTNGTENTDPGPTAPGL